MIFNRKKHMPLFSKGKAPIGSQLSFVAAEAYKLLRTNLVFSLPDEKGCRVIGVTSALRGEGKSTTSLNLAYTIAEANKKVLLIEMDLRLPVIAKRLSISKAPGLSNFLVGLNNAGEVIQSSGIHENLFVITAGNIPPNPSELLGSKEMVTTIEVMSQNFEYIIIDLPPVNAVSDALVVSKLTHGMIMVVRQDYNNQRELDEAMRQLKIVGANVLGFVLHQSESREGKNYKKYGYEYGYGHEYRKKT
jgi:capsular exopolysaccharide synthesis family protein